MNPVQITRAGMDPRHLKDTCGGRLTFWSRGGGHVFQQVHNLQAGVPPAGASPAGDWAGWKPYVRF